MITLTKEEAQQVLDTVDDIPHFHNAVIETLRARLSAPEPEPVAWLHSFTGYGWQVVPEKLYPTDQPLYTAPPQREWQGLTDEEKKAIYEKADAENWHDQPLLEAIEAKLKEKNT